MLKETLFHSTTVNKDPTRSSLSNQKRYVVMEMKGDLYTVQIADQIRAMKNRLKDSRGRTMQIFVTTKHAPFAHMPAAEVDAIKVNL